MKAFLKELFLFAIMVLIPGASFAILILGVAFSDEAVRKIDFTAILTEDGAPIIDAVTCPVDRASAKFSCNSPLTLGHAAYWALHQGEQGMSWAESAHWDELAHSIKESKEWPLLEDDRQRIERAMPKVWGPGVIGAASKLLDQK